LGKLEASLYVLVEQVACRVTTLERSLSGNGGASTPTSNSGQSLTNSSTVRAAARRVLENADREDATTGAGDKNNQEQLINEFCSVYRTLYFVLFRTMTTY
jgi:hypothetical protein